jgi:hypothetical protein
MSIHVPDGLEPLLKAGLVAMMARAHPRYITGCVLSGLLSARFAHLTPTIGLIDRSTALRHYETLNDLGFRAADLHLDDTRLDAAIVHDFRTRHGSGRHNPVGQH